MLWETETSLCQMTVTIFELNVKSFLEALCLVGNKTVP